MVSGPWGNDFEVDAGVSSVLRVHCNLYGCNRWDSGYNLFDLDSTAGGQDSLSYSPQSRTAAWSVGGIVYSFSPQAMTAGTINVGTLNATTVRATIGTLDGVTIGGTTPAPLSTSHVVNAAGFQHFHVPLTATALGQGAYADTVFSFPIAEPDTSYSLVCMDDAGSVGTSYNAQATLTYYGPTTTGAVLRVTNTGSGVNGGVADCILIHD